ncbi:MAG: hypothetical protein ACTSSB_11370, partial [Candidatus Heimdallarchaeota archaeon]
MVFKKKEIKGKKVREYSKKTAKSQIKKIKASKLQKNAEMQEKLAFITKVARDDLAKRFTKNQLASAVSGKEKEGYAVHGYLEEAYPEDWEALIYVQIFDRACYYAEQEPIIAITRLTSDITLKDYIKTPIELREEVIMDNYPHQPFKRCIILAKKQFEDSVHWVNDYPFDFDGVDVNVNHASFNLALLGWAMYNLPIFIVLHAPNKDEGINDARVRAEDIKEIKVDIRQKLISIQRNEIEPLKAQVFEKE